MRLSNSLIIGTAAIICTALISFTISDTVQQVQQQQRTVVVKGLAEREVAADTAIWPLPIVHAANDPTEIYRNLANDMAAIKAFLRENGFSDAEMTVSAPAVFDKAAARYSDYDERKDFRYSGQQTLTVYTEKVEMVRTVRQQLSQLGQQGVALGGSEYEHAVEYHFNGLNSIKPSMIEESAANARAVALRFAEHSDSQLGKIARAQQGQFSISDRDSNTPHLKIVRVVSTVAYQLVD
ncbi:SIMPL domain-containing protein [Pseudidiomarina taiwanensis]|uniref:SIMPL domain-containing protein n=1 Tax=Pseudidiomarina taiwanensis TaxID=337250 RepID=A0A432ZP47_9GAMM|nr:SIMPL domain-containing protein [Pseudidiomarina taiwanensis]RUO79631.1 hypothetical protein CWI83_03810 [Pseudidiomarina taiwanensis]